MSHYLVTTIEDDVTGQRLNSFWVCAGVFANFTQLLSAVSKNGKYARTILTYKRIDLHFCKDNSINVIDNLEAIKKSKELFDSILDRIRGSFKGKTDSEDVPEPDFTRFPEKEIEQRLARYSSERDHHKYNIGDTVEVVKALYGNSQIKSKIGKFARIHAFAGLDAEGTPEYFLSFENRLDGYCYRETELSDENVTKETSPEHDRQIEDLTKDQ